MQLTGDKSGSDAGRWERFAPDFGGNLDRPESEQASLEVKELTGGERDSISVRFANSAMTRKGKVKDGKHPNREILKGAARNFVNWFDRNGQPITSADEFYNAAPAALLDMVVARITGEENALEDPDLD